MYSLDLVNGFYIALNLSLTILIGSLFVFFTVTFAYHSARQSKNWLPLLTGIIFILILAAVSFVSVQGQWVELRLNSCDWYHGCLPGVILPREEFNSSGSFSILLIFLPTFIVGFLIGKRKQSL